MRLVKTAFSIIIYSFILFGCQKSDIDNTIDTMDITLNIEPPPLVYPFDVAIYSYPFEIEHGGGPPESSLHGLRGNVRIVEAYSSHVDQDSMEGDELDREGRILRHWDILWDYTNVRTFEYDESTGDLVRMSIEYIDDGVVFDSREYEYIRITENGVSEIRTINVETNDVEKIEHQQLEGDTFIWTLEKPIDSGNIWVYKYSPFPSSFTEHIRIEHVSSALSLVFIDEIEFTWTDGRLVQEIHRSVPSGDTATRDYEYDVDGFLSKWSQSGSDGYYREFIRSQLEVDDQGNWTLLVFEGSDGHPLTHRRTITYFDSPEGDRNAEAVN